MAFSFRGGIHPDEKKDLTSAKLIEKLAPPQFVVLPVSMHIGAPCEPIVKVNDIVDLGQKIADSEASVSAPIHASVSGRVAAIDRYPHPNGELVLSVVIENDGEDRLSPSISPIDIDGMSDEEICACIRESGIVGHGGAAFPTHVKIRSGLGKVDKILLNGAECEPYITSDERIMLEHTEEVIGGAEILKRIFKVPEVLIGVEQNKPNAILALRDELKNRTDIKVCVLKTKYPQGAEKQLIHALTKREVPSGKLPADTGCVVFNVDTTAAIFRYIKTGMPFIRRIVTVSGSAVSNPKNLNVRLGTPLRNLVEATGDFREPPNKLIMGGPMMGVSQFSLDAPVIKGTNAFLAFCGNEDPFDKNPTCIRCGKCVAACPMRLTPVFLYMNYEKGRIEECKKLGMLDCTECGSCSYICPGRLYLVQAFRAGKAKIQEAMRRQEGK